MAKSSFWKGFLSGAVVCTILLSGTVYADGGKLIEVFFCEIKIMIDGQEKRLSDGKSFVYEGLTYVPLRFVSESLGNKVSWNEETQTIWIGKDEAQFVEQDRSARQVLDKSLNMTGLLQSLTIDMKTRLVTGKGTDMSIGMNSFVQAEIVHKPKLLLSGIIGVSLFDSPISVPFYYSDRLYIKDKIWKVEKEPISAIFPEEIYDPSTLLKKLGDTTSIIRLHSSQEGLELQIEGTEDSWKYWVNIFYPDSKKPDSKNLTVHKLNLRLIIDRDTYLPQKLEATMDISTNDGEELDQQEITVNLLYSGYDKLTELPIPENLNLQKIN